MNGKALHLGRLFPERGNAVIVAINHGQTLHRTRGLVDFASAAERLQETDGLLLAPQMIRFSGAVFLGQGSPTAIVGLNWNSVRCQPWGCQRAHIVDVLPVRQAVAGADVVLTSLVMRTGDERNDALNVAAFARATRGARELSIPLIGEVFPVAGLRERPEAFHDYVVRTCRIACELGPTPSRPSTPASVSPR